MMATALWFGIKTDVAAESHQDTLNEYTWVWMWPPPSLSFAFCHWDDTQTRPSIPHATRSRCACPQTGLLSPGKADCYWIFFLPLGKKRTKRRLRARGGLQYGRVGVSFPHSFTFRLCWNWKFERVPLEPQATRPPWPLWHDICIKLENCIQPIL